MKAVTWHGKRDVRVDTFPDPGLEEPTDAIIEVTSTNICGSDLHLYENLGAFRRTSRSRTEESLPPPSHPTREAVYLGRDARGGDTSSSGV